MLQIFQQHLYSKKVEQPDFDENKVYLCTNHEGNDYLLDPGNNNDKPFFVAVFPTEELLLNLARQHQSGQDIHVMMDASNRVSTERNVGTFQLKLALSPKQAALWHMLWSQRRMDLLTILLLMQYGLPWKPWLPIESRVVAFIFSNA
jgi:hypothetical protein